MPTVLTMGTFDPVHSGHLGLFRQCRRLAGEHGKLVISVNSDDFVMFYKGVAPLLPERVRLDLIGGLAIVDEVVLNTEHELQKSLIETVSPDMLVIGLDWAFKDYYGQLGISQEWLDERNIQMVYVPRTGEWSSSELKHKSYEQIRSHPDAGDQPSPR